MSSDRPASTSSIIPDGFTDAYEAETVEEALRRAEKAPSTTPAAEFDRCRSCGSRRIREKIGSRHPQPNRVDGEIKCVSCSAHFDEPLPPTAEFSVADPGCPECGSFRLVEDTGDAYECLRCGWNGEAVADDPPDSYVPMTDARTDPFDWADDDLADPDDRGDGPTLPGVDDETLAEIVVALYDTSAASYRDLAEVVPYSREWVGSRVRERKADEPGGGSE